MFVGRFMQKFRRKRSGFGFYQGRRGFALKYQLSSILTNSSQSYGLINSAHDVTKVSCEFPNERAHITVPYYNAFDVDNILTALLHAYTRTWPKKRALVSVSHIRKCRFSALNPQCDEIFFSNLVCELSIMYSEHFTLTI